MNDVPMGDYRLGSPKRNLLRRLSDKWTILALCSLLPGTKRFRELRMALIGSSNKVLSAALRRLEREGLIDRRVYPVVPSRVEYSLTALGRELARLLDQVRRWAELNVKRVAKAQAEYDARDPRPSP